MILHAWADYGRESEVLSRYGDVIRCTINPKNLHREPVVKSDATMLPIKDGSMDIGLFHPHCQKWSNQTKYRERYPDHLDSTRREAKRTCKYYIIENVPQAPLIDPVVLDGRMFGNKIAYPRAFETNFNVKNPPEIKYENKMSFNTGGKKYEWEIAKGYPPSRNKKIDCKWKNARNELIPSYYIRWLMDQITDKNVEAPF